MVLKVHGADLVRYTEPALKRGTGRFMGQFSADLLNLHGENAIAVFGSKKSRKSSVREFLAGIPRYCTAGKNSLRALQIITRKR